MKLRIVPTLLFYAMLLNGCQPGSNAENKVPANDTGTATTQLADTTASQKVTAVKADSIPADSSSRYNADPAVAQMIRTSLTNVVLKDDLQNIPGDQRKFKYHAFDLNDDKLDEYLVTITGSYFCGTGGCGFYIFDHYGKLVSSFTVSDFPIYVAASISEGWHDLIIKSGNKFHYVKMKGKKYPGNPSVAPLYKGDPPNMAPQLLDVYEGAYPEFSF